MSPRPRKKGFRDLPLNLYAKHDKRTDKIYFHYKDPRNGKCHGLGTDKTSAVIDANQLNITIYDHVRTIKREKIEKASMLMSEWVDIYYKLRENELSPNSLRSLRSQNTKIKNSLGSIPLRQITTLQVSEFINQYVGTIDRTAQVLRSTLIKMFKYAIAKGHLDRNTNPAEITLTVKVDVKRARLTKSDFDEIFKASSQLDPWVQNSILLALLTGQRVSDIAAVKFKDVKDGFLYIEQIKTGNRIKIDLNLSLPGYGSVGDCIKKCRDRVVSPYIIHHTLNRNNAKPGEPVHLNTVSKGFKKARDKTKLKWPEDKDPPSFHELRSLSERLYKKQGINTQELLGHKDSRMTDKYHDARGAEWIEVKAN